VEKKELNKSSEELFLEELFLDAFWQNISVESINYKNYHKDHIETLYGNKELLKIFNEDYIPHISTNRPEDLVKSQTAAWQIGLGLSMSVCLKIMKKYLEENKANWPNPGCELIYCGKEHCKKETHLRLE
jgi:hypothetical protein